MLFPLFLFTAPFGFLLGALRRPFIVPCFISSRLFFFSRYPRVMISDDARGNCHSDSGRAPLCPFPGNIAGRLPIRLTLSLAVFGLIIDSRGLIAETNGCSRRSLALPTCLFPFVGAVGTASSGSRAPGLGISLGSGSNCLPN